MAMNRCSTGCDKSDRAVVVLLIALILSTSIWSLNPSEAGMHVAVHEGEISVDLRAAQIREVLAVIGQQAGLRVYFDEAANGVVDAQFSGLALDQGIRRLLRAASLSYSLIYTQGSAEGGNLREVCVFGEARGEATPRYDRARLGRGEGAAALVSAITREESPEPELLEPDEDMSADHGEPEQELEVAQD